MDGLKWSKTFETGVPEIDGEHRHLFALAESIGEELGRGDLRLSEAKVRDFIDAAESHFANEEKILVRIGFPDVEDHRVYHASLVAKAKQLREVCHVEKTIEKADACYHEVLAFLVDDVVRGDTQFKSYLHHHGLGPARFQN